MADLKVKSQPLFGVQSDLNSEHVSISHSCFVNAAVLQKALTSVTVVKVGRPC